MGTHTLGTALAAALGGAKGARKVRSGAPHRTGARVLRGSVEAGTFEHVFFAPPAKGETDHLLRAARRILDAGRQLRSEARAGTRSLTPAEGLLTTLTAASVRVFEELLTLSRLNRGQVFPSYDHLAQATSLGRATVARALRILEGIGFLVRQRRFKRIEDAEGPGPRYEQTSNAYRTFLPRIVADYLPRWMRPAPLPQDVTHREETHAEDMALMVKSLSCRELAEAHVGGALGKVLARLGAALDRQERESQTDTQPLPDSYITRPYGAGLDGQPPFA
ncbi:MULTISPECIES: helix-turn-helix domain-containing protein [unclassified Novosphingobium]|uniref:helix-turn-helix domain-containing protein n=1 Tax=unclassified Novosphingobium TaxID=2644732 RepID=UPI00135C2B67|nr:MULTISPECIES: helix-turn-helix domain-containing protein [unclassified Novosphingobium]